MEVPLEKKEVKYRSLIQLFSQHRKRQITLLVICTLSIIADILFVYQIQDLIDFINQHVPFQKLLTVFFRIATLGTVSFLLNLIQMRKWHHLRHLLMNSMRVRMFQS